MGERKGTHGRDKPLKRQQGSYPEDGNSLTGLTQPGGQNHSLSAKLSVPRLATGVGKRALWKKSSYPVAVGR